MFKALCILNGSYHNIMYMSKRETFGQYLLPNVAEYANMQNKLILVELLRTKIRLKALEALTKLNA